MYHSFLSPFSEVPCRLQDIDFPIPTEYIINCQIKDKLAPIDLSRYQDDTLFYLFYMYTGDLMQLQAASTLYDRDWRYHTERRFWLTKVPGIEPQQKTNTYEKGIYTVFDVSQWRKTQVELTIEYNKLAKNPKQQFLLPSIGGVGGGSAVGSVNSAATAASLLNPAVFQQQLQQQQGLLNAGNSNTAGVSTNQPTPTF